MAEAFIKGAKESSNIVKQFDVNKTDIRGCIAYNNCWGDEKPCVHSDEFNKFVDRMERADVVAFVSPVYWGSYPAPLKALIDKMYAFAVPWCKKDMGNKQTVLLTCGDGPNDSAFKVINLLHESLAKFMRWDVMEPIDEPELVEAGAILKTDALKKVEELGRRI